MKMLYENAASEWTQALPLGNGFMGAMVYGGVSGRYDLSENTCWSGAEQEHYLVENAGELMKEARELLLIGEYTRAEELMTQCNGLKINYGTQVPLQKLFVETKGDNVYTRRELDLNSGLILERVNTGSAEFERTSFISHEYKIMCVKIFSSGNKLPKFTVRTENFDNEQTTAADSGSITIKGKALDSMHSDGKSGVLYNIKLSLETDGNSDCSDGELIIENASYILLYITANTDMFDADYISLCDKRIATAKNDGFNLICKKHIESHSKLMSSCTLNLSKNKNSFLPADLRRVAFKEDVTDYDLIALYFQYGRYLLLNSSRSDSLLPAALQGIWNDNRACKMGWTDDMHLDINTQMNYYPAEATGLSESTAPLYKWIKERLMPNGKRIAKELYGAPGWCSHTISNARGWAAPGWEGCGWAFNITSGGWIASHIYEHYKFTGDVEFLREYYDVLYESAKFLSAILCENTNGELVTNPSYSPENAFRVNNEIHTISTGATVDIAVTKYIFDAVISSAEILGRNDEFIERIKSELTKLPPFKYGRHGQLMEWNEDFDEPIADHRHMSHLLSLHPFNLIDTQKTPELCGAVRKSIERRMSGDPKDIIWANWAGALLIIFNARLEDAKSAEIFIRPMISFLSRENLMITHDNGIYELDGNTGFTCGICEMLMQSHTGDIAVLPAVPDSWESGEFTGLVAYGGHVVDVKWNSVSVDCRVMGGRDCEVMVRYKNEKRIVKIKKDNVVELNFTKN